MRGRIILRLQAPLAASVFFIASCGFSDSDQSESLTSRLSEESLSELERSIPALLDSGDVTGLSIAFVSDSGIVWSAGFGEREATVATLIVRSSVFEAASLSKPVFAYAVLRLVDQEIISLDEPISSLYQYEDIAHDPRYTSITPRIIMSHSAGFPNWRRRGQQLTIDFDPGSLFSYSGEGFVYLQLAVMSHLGEPLDMLVKRLVFDPLEMSSSSYLWRDDFEGRLASPHGSEGEVLTKRKPRPGQGNAAASLHTTAIDYARFIQALMNGTGLSDRLAIEMLRPQIEVDSGVSWGLGIGLQANPFGTAFWHWGDNTGYKAFTVAYPEHGVGVVWFTNSENGHSILNELLSATLGGDYPASSWLDYEQYDSPVRYVRQRLERVFAEDGLDAAISEYRLLKESQPPEAFTEHLLNALGYRLLRGGQVEDAIVVFELNVAEYPDASNPYDSLGEAYLTAGDTALAIQNYQRSLDLDPTNSNAQSVLQNLGVEWSTEG